MALTRWFSSLVVIVVILGAATGSAGIVTDGNGEMVFDEQDTDTPCQPHDPRKSCDPFQPHFSVQDMISDGFESDQSIRFESLIAMTHAHLYQRLGLISQEEMDLAEVYERKGIRLGLHFNETRRKQLCVLSLWVAAGNHGSLRDGGWAWYILKLGEGAYAKYMLTGGFYQTFPLGLYDFTMVFTNHLKHATDTSYMTIHVTVERPGSDVQYMLQEWSALETSLKDKKTYSDRCGDSDTTVPVLEFKVAMESN